jgi:hypothetical protein
VQHVGSGFGHVAEPLEYTLHAAIGPRGRASGRGDTISREASSYGTHAASSSPFTPDTFNDSQLGRHGSQGHRVASTASSAVVRQLVAEGDTAGPFSAPTLCLKCCTCAGSDHQTFVFPESVHDPTQQHGRGIITVCTFASHTHDPATTL